MDKRHIIISDVHGCAKEFEALLQKVNYNSFKDQLVLLGDYVDRGPDSRECVNMVKNLVRGGAIALKGNHEDMLIKAFLENDKTWVENAMHNGAKKTIDSYGDDILQFQEDLKWLNKLPIQHEIEDYRFVHAGVNINKAWGKQNSFVLLWERENWFMKEFDGKLPEDEEPKFVVYGHTPTPFLWRLKGEGEKCEVYESAYRTAIDCGLVFGGKLAAYILPECDIVYQEAL